MRELKEVFRLDRLLYQGPAGFWFLWEISQRFLVDESYKRKSLSSGGLFGKCVSIIEGQKRSVELGSNFSNSLLILTLLLRWMPTSSHLKVVSGSVPERGSKVSAASCAPHSRLAMPLSPMFHNLEYADLLLLTSSKISIILRFRLVLWNVPTDYGRLFAHKLQVHIASPFEQNSRIVIIHLLLAFGTRQIV